MFFANQYDYDRSLYYIGNEFAPETADNMIQLAATAMNSANAGKICTSCSLIYKSCTDYIELYTENAIYEIHMYYIKVRRFNKSYKEKDTYGYYPKDKSNGKKWFRYMSKLIRTFKPFNFEVGSASDEIMRLYGC